MAHYIKERTKNAQFVIISLRNNMFELADRLVGMLLPDPAWHVGRQMFVRQCAWLLRMLAKVTSLIAEGSRSRGKKFWHRIQSNCQHIVSCSIPA